MSVPSALTFPTSSGVTLLFAAAVALSFAMSCSAAVAPQKRIPLPSSSGLIFNLSENMYFPQAYAPSNEGPTTMNGIFVTFLWTQEFIGSKGYAFGFWGVPIPDQQFAYDFYLCVCLGQIQQLSNTSSGWSSVSWSATGRLGSSEFEVSIILGSLAVPVWSANLECPLAYVNASLNVAANKERVLELRDGNGRLAWSLFIGDNGAFMELQNSGNLVILNSANRIVWQSFQHPTDTLVVGQNFSEGMSLTSNDSVFSVAMEPRGLAFYLINSSQTGTSGPNNASFWILPSISPAQSPAATSRSFVLGYVEFSSTEGVFCMLFDDKWHHEKVDLVRLEGDGRLHFYSVTQYSLDDINTLDALYCNDLQNNLTIPPSIWGACDTPMECGPMGLCLPNASGPDPCTCPAAAAGAATTTPVFKLIDEADVHKGCRLTSNLHSNFCARSTNANTLWDFLEVKHTATIFQFSNDILTTNTLTTTINNCKERCRLHCNCLGVIFNDNKSLCFPMTDHRLSLLQVANYTNFSYTTFLKVAQVATEPIAHGAATNKHQSITVIVATICGVVVLIIAALTFYGCHRHIFIKKPGCNNSDNQGLEMALSTLPTKFSHKELHKATQGFNNLIGKGGMGSVYAGALPNGKAIAVKKLDIVLKGDILSKVFLAEVATMGKTSHLNIVQLVGFCWETDHQMLVCEYMENGSLDGWLFKPGKDKLLDWATRFRIAMGIAKGLAYLHEGCSQPILHLDIKPQNILLDTDFEPKLADFGLSRFMPREASLVVTVARGTPGYMAPEMTSSIAPLSKKCDIYSLGIVLLEVIAGRKSVVLEWLMATLNARNAGEEDDEQEHVLMITSKAIEFEEEEWHLPSWAAKRCTEGRKMEVVDKQLQGAFCEEEASRMIEVALWCIQDNPSLRPSAETVVQWLEGSIVPLESAPFSSVAHSQSRVKSSIQQASMSLVSAR